MKALAVVPAFTSTGPDLDVLLTCLRTLRETEPDVDVLVVDDGSPDAELLDALEGQAAALEFELYRKTENEGFSRTVNVGLHRALEQGVDAVLVNADIEFARPGWLEQMQRQRTDGGEGLAAVVGARLLYPSGLIQHAGIFFSMLTRTFDHIYRYAPPDLPEALLPRRCPVTAALMFIRHECLNSVGLYDEGFLLGWEDVDYCVRVFQSGRECVYQPDVWAIHHESMFRGRENEKLAEWQRRSWGYFLNKYRDTNFQAWVPTLL